jgi:hypothetical protein
MKIVKLILIMLIVLYLNGCMPPSNYYNPRQILVTDLYYHNPTRVEFPVKIGVFDRASITVFDKEETNIAVDYRSNDNQDQTHFTIYIYPAGVGTDERLHNEFFKVLKAITISEHKGIDARQSAFHYTHDGYSFVGITAKINGLKNAVYSKLTLFECGQYFLKFRMSTNLKRSENLDSLQESLLEKFNPSLIVKKCPLIPLANVHVAPGAFQDSLSLYSILGAAKEEYTWAVEHVDSLERCSGFPGLYLDGQVATFSEMVKCWKENPKGFKRYPNNYLESLEKIVDKGFLKEFIMDEFSMLLYLPREEKFNFDDYYKWKKKTLPQFNLKSRFFVISYDK